MLFRYKVVFEEICLKKTAVNRNMTAEIEKRDRIINHVKSKIAEIETADIEECLYFKNSSQELKISFCVFL